MKDPIVAQVHRTRRKLMKRFNHDLTRCTEYAKKRWSDWPAGHVSFDENSKPILRRPENSPPWNVYISRKLAQPGEEEFGL